MIPLLTEVLQLVGAAFMLAGTVPFLKTAVPITKRFPSLSCSEVYRNPTIGGSL